MTKAIWEGKGLFDLLFQITVHHERKSGQELNTGQEPGGRSGCRDHEWVLLTRACSACLIIEPWTTSPGMAPPKFDPPHKSLIKKMTYRRHFLNGGSHVSDDSVVC